MSFPSLPINEHEPSFVHPSPLATPADDRRLDVLLEQLTTWRAYTPTWNGTLGNGTIEGRYLYVGRYVVAHAYLLWGSTTSGPSATFQIGLPVAFASLVGDTNQTIGYGTVHEEGGNYWTISFQRGGDNSKLAGRINASTTFVSDNSPFTWGSTDKLWLTATYEAASARAV